MWSTCAATTRASGRVPGRSPGPACASTSSRCSASGATGSGRRSPTYAPRCCPRRPCPGSTSSRRSSWTTLLPRSTSPTWSTGRTRCVAALRTVAYAPGAALVHCAAGKDRTGTVVALALSVAGVERDAVVADYAASSERVEQVVARLMSSPTYAENLRGRPISSHLSRPETMIAFLDHIDQAYGGVGGDVDQDGLDRGRHRPAAGEAAGLIGCDRANRSRRGDRPGRRGRARCGRRRRAGQPGDQADRPARPGRSSGAGPVPTSPAVEQIRRPPSRRPAHRRAAQRTARHRTTTRAAAGRLSGRLRPGALRHRPRAGQHLLRDRHRHRVPARRPDRADRAAHRGPGRLGRRGGRRPPVPATVQSESRRPGFAVAAAGPRGAGHHFALRRSRPTSAQAVGVVGLPVGRSEPTLRTAVVGPPDETSGNRVRLRACSRLNGAADLGLSGAPRRRRQRRRGGHDRRRRRARAG